MSSCFIGANNLVIYNAYSRKDVGFDNTRTALMNINQSEKIAFLNIDGEYANILTKKGFFLNPRDDLNNDRLIIELQESITYIFLRNGNIGLYYYIGICDYAIRHNSTYIYLNVNVKTIPKELIQKLGGFKLLA